MKAAHTVLAIVALALPAKVPGQVVNYSIVPVGDAGNANDTTGYGAVPYSYGIGKYEVTIGQYVSFLNAVARTDPYGLWNASMQSNKIVGGISRTGSSGSYLYAAIGPFGAIQIPQASAAERPITSVSWFDAARFANWMSNGQPAGSQNSFTTENGSYALNAAVSGTAPAMNTINPNTGATPLYRIPTENEWYKAAYYKGGGIRSGYWDYATQSDSPPGNTIGSGVNQANYFAGKFAITASTGPTDGQNHLTNVGAFSSSSSAYGTFDQNGNVEELNDLNGDAGSSRGSRGGSWSFVAFDLSSVDRSTRLASIDSALHGFRLSSPPVPQGVTILVSSGTQTQSQAGYSSLTPYFAASLAKTGSGTLVVDAVNTYSGVTSVKVGAIAFSGSGSIAASSSVQVALGAVFDVSAMAGGYSVPSGQTLGGEGIVLGSVAFGAGSTLSPGSLGAGVSLGALQMLAVPEPGAWMMAVAGLAWIASRRSRESREQAARRRVQSV